MLTAKLGDIERKHGLGDAKAVRESAIFEMYKAHIKQLKAQARACWGGVRRRWRGCWRMGRAGALRRCA